MTGGALEHRGVLHDGPDGLVAAVLPTVRAAVEAGDAVILMLDRRGSRELRAALGPAGDAIVDVAPSEVFRPEPIDFLRRLRAEVVPGRRALVVGAYPALDVDPAAHALVEDGIDTVLTDLPLTVLCTCPRDAHPDARARLVRQHGRMQDGDAVAANPGHRPGPDRSPVPAATWGPPVLHAGFRELAELRALRRSVAAVVADAGLAGQGADAALLAVHEAAVLACAMRVDGADECTVEVRAAGGAMLTEVTAPGTGPLDAEPLDVVRLFSRAATLDTTADRRRIRLLSAS